MKVITDGNFEVEVLSSDKVVVVDFWADWCGPCKMLSPVISQVSQEFGDSAHFVKVDVDSNPLTTQKFRIASIPTVLVFKNGEIVDNIVGFKPKETIKQIVSRHI